jgi:hypothetical protein
MLTYADVKHSSGPNWGHTEKWSVGAETRIAYADVC